MQILIPMSGLGSRFSAAGYLRPKPFVEFLGKTMIENVIENLGYNNDYILVVRREHYIEYADVFARISQRVSGFDAVILDSVTRGAAESCLLAKTKLDPDSPLMIANCDQIFNYNLIEFKSWFLNSNLDGVLMIFDSQSDKNSYVELDSNGLVTRVVEKEVISRYATTGIHVWKAARDFLSAAEEMINNDIKTNGEFYIAPTYNINIAKGQKIGTFYIKHHFPIGTPEDLHKYLDHLCCSKHKS